MSLRRSNAGRALLAFSIMVALLPFAEIQASASAPQAASQPSGASLIAGCLNGTSAVPAYRARIGFLIPTFTLTPYYNWGTSFYAFYIKYNGAGGMIRTDLDLLRTRVVANFSPAVLMSEVPFVQFLKSQAAARCGVVYGLNLWFTDDVAVDGGALFAGHTKTYDVLILGHEEYVTRAEYDQLRDFVAAGGRLVDMSGNSFWGEVNYSRSTGFETFVAGHGFQFNGKYAQTTGYEPYDGESAGWFGSTFANGVFVLQGAVVQTNGPFGTALAEETHGKLAFTDYNYPHDEVNFLRNLTGTEIVAKFFVTAFKDAGTQRFVMPSLPVDAYSHAYRRGEIFCLCVFGESIISHDQGAQFFLVYAATLGFDLTTRFDSSRLL